MKLLTLWTCSECLTTISSVRLGWTLSKGCWMELYHLEHTPPEVPANKWAPWLFFPHYHYLTIGAKLFPEKSDEEERGLHTQLHTLCGMWLSATVPPEKWDVWLKRLTWGFLTRKDVPHYWEVNTEVLLAEAHLLYPVTFLPLENGLYSNRVCQKKHIQKECGLIQGKGCVG